MNKAKKQHSLISQILAVDFGCHGGLATAGKEKRKGARRNLFPFSVSSSPRKPGR
jgi:hypothetical protein